MPLTLEQYADHLAKRDLVWPSPPEPHGRKARPHLVRLPEVRAVLWNAYGTLLNIFGGQLLFEHPQKFVMEVALDKTVQEFKMWGSMTRKPGQPSAYLKEIYASLLAEMKALPGSRANAPAIAADRLWEGVIKKLLQKDYKFDT